MWQRQQTVQIRPIIMRTTCSNPSLKLLKMLTGIMRVGTSQAGRTKDAVGEQGESDELHDDQGNVLDLGTFARHWPKEGGYHVPCQFIGCRKATNAVVDDGTSLYSFIECVKNEKDELVDGLDYICEESNNS